MTTTAPHTAAPYTSTVLPVLHASDDELARLRDFLRRSEFTFGELFRRGGDDNRGNEIEASLRLEDLSDACGVLRALFVGARPVLRTVIEERFAPGDLALVERLGLLRQHDVKPELVLGSVMICPIAGLWLFADHPYFGAGRKMAPDVVYSPLTTNTQHFMLMLTRQPCDEMLELCSGSGVAALASARLANRVVAVDITERSTVFAALNARFNEIDTAEALEGDLYAPVAGRTFDRIVAHPPYMPAFETEYIFRDGGADGEEITQRIIAGLPDYLRPGGRFQCVCLATDRTDAPLEQRIRGWLGARAGEFDVMLVEMQSPRDPTEFYAHRAYDQGGGFAEVEPRHRFFKERGVTRLVYGAILIQRRQRPRAVFTERRKKGMLTAAPHLDWAMSWQTVVQDPAFVPRLLDAVPHVSPSMRMQLGYSPRSDGFALVDARLLTETPLAFEVDCPGWVPQFLERCIAPHTVREHLAALQHDGVVPADVAPERFAEALRDLATAGIILFEGLEPPPPDGQLATVLDEWPVASPSALDRLAAQSG